MGMSQILDSSWGRGLYHLLSTNNLMEFTLCFTELGSQLSPIVRARSKWIIGPGRAKSS